MDTFPVTPNGKLDRKALLQADAPGRSREFTPPRTMTEIAVAEIWMQLLGLPQVGVHDNFFELGGHSLKAASATFQISNRLKRNKIGLVDFYRNPTIAAVAELLDGVAQKQELLQQLSRNEAAELTLVCCPYAGAAPTVFQPLAQALAHAGGIDVYAIAIPGNEFGTEAASGQTVETLAAACVQDILVKIHGKIGIYGHCVGSYLAMEIAYRLEQAGREVQFLSVGGAFPATRLERWLMPLDTWKSKSDEEIHALIQSWGGAAGSLDPQVLQFMIGNFRRDSQMAIHYERGRKRIKIKAPIYSIFGTADLLTPNPEKNCVRWKQVSNNVHLRVIDGAQHYFVGDRAAEVADILSRIYAIDAVCRIGSLSNV